MRSQINRHSLLLVTAFLALLFPSDVYANSMGGIGVVYVLALAIIGLPLLISALFLIFHLSQLTFSGLPFLEGQDLTIRSKKVLFWNSIFSVLLVVLATVVVAILFVATLELLRNLRLPKRLMLIRAIVPPV